MRGPAVALHRPRAGWGARLDHPRTLSPLVALYHSVPGSCRTHPSSHSSGEDPGRGWPDSGPLQWPGRSRGHPPVLPPPARVSEWPCSGRRRQTVTELPARQGEAEIDCSFLRTLHAEPLDCRLELRIDRAVVRQLARAIGDEIPVSTSPVRKPPGGSPLQGAVSGRIIRSSVLPATPDDRPR